MTAPNHQYPPPHLAPMFRAVADWRQMCLLDGGSLFCDQSLWRRGLMEEVARVLVAEAGEGPGGPNGRDGKFYRTLKRRMAVLPPRTALLLVEVLWVLLLAQRHITLSKKRAHIQRAAAWAGVRGGLSSPALQSAVLQGLAATPRNFNIYLERSLDYLVQILLALLRMPADRRAQRLGDAHAMKHWLDERTGDGERMMRNIFLYLLFPEDFISVFDRTNRRKIISTYAPGRASARMGDREMEVQLELIRLRLSDEHGRPIDFMEDRDIFVHWSQPKELKPRHTAGVPIEYPGLKAALR